jgi:hypothetical protein
MVQAVFSFKIKNKEFAVRSVSVSYGSDSNPLKLQDDSSVAM